VRKGRGINIGRRGKDKKGGKIRKGALMKGGGGGTNEGGSCGERKREISYAY